MAVKHYDEKKHTVNMTAAWSCSSFVVTQGAWSVCRC